MAKRRISMNKVREIIRLHEQCALSDRSIARALCVSRPVVTEYIGKIRAAGLGYAAIRELDDEVLLELIEGPGTVHSERYQVLGAKFDSLVRELKRPGVTLQRLWQEYRTEHPDGYAYSQFCYHFQMWRSMCELTMHIDHKAGDKAFVDFAGKPLHIVDPKTGQLLDAQVFICILGASQYTYVEATATQQKHDWIGANCHAFEYFGGVPRAVVPDCTKTAVSKADRYEPDIHPEYDDFARHYQTVILPARPVRPRDKALVENAVRLVYNRIYAALRNRVFHSLRELNLAIAEELDTHNNTPMQRLRVSRKQLFIETERSALLPLPAQPYQSRSFKAVKAQFNYHVYLSDDRHYYSVPYRYRGHTVKLAYTHSTVEIFHNNTRIALHHRDRTPGGYTTDPDHMPSAHRFVSEWSPQRFIHWAGNIGEHVQIVVTRVLQSRKHPEQAYKTCMGILNLARTYDRQRLDTACQRAISFDLYTYKGIKNILEKNLENYQLDSFEPLPSHANIRGHQYYASGVRHDQ